MAGEVTGKSQLISKDFSQFCRDLQSHDLGLGLWLGLRVDLETKSSLWVHQELNKN